MKYYKDISVFLVSFKETLYICCRKNSRIDWIGKLINFGVTFESVDYKEDEHSNHVIRSFITSSVRLSIKKGRFFVKKGRPFCWLCARHERSEAKSKHLT